MILVEHYINLLTDKAEKEKYFDEVWDLLQKSYAKIGGVQGTDKAEMMQDNFLWKLVKRGGKIVACQIYKLTDHGRKVVLGGAEQDEETGKATERGKNDLYKVIDDDIRLTDRMSYAEVSDAMEHIYIDKRGAKPLPAKYAKKFLGNKKIEIEPDGYHYTRMIGGEPHTKIMVGYPKE